MFLENASRKGWIEVICGSMFSGKTEELIRRLKRAQFAHQKVEIYKPRIDVRYSEEEVVSHDANAIRSTPVDTAQNILLMSSEVDVVGIDEAQFFDESIVDVCRRLANNGVRVIVAGLDMDYTGKPFGPMPALMATAVNSLKYSCKVMRPDGSTRNSFPSGHTATAFMAATMLHKEYGHLSP